MLHRGGKGDAGQGGGRGDQGHAETGICVLDPQNRPTDQTKVKDKEADQASKTYLCPQLQIEHMRMLRLLCVAAAEKRIDGMEILRAEAHTRQAELPQHPQGSLPDIHAVQVGGILHGADGQDPPENRRGKERQGQKHQQKEQRQHPLLAEKEHDQRRQRKADPAGARIGHQQCRQRQRQQKRRRQPDAAAVQHGCVGKGKRQQQHEKFRVVVRILKGGIHAPGHPGVGGQIGLRGVYRHPGQTLPDCDGRGAD